MLLNRLKSIANTRLRELFGVQLNRITDNPVVHSTSDRRWDYSVAGGWVGGRFEVPNYSTGYHGILLQWLECYGSGPSCLLVSENNQVKAAFEQRYSNLSFVTLDKYDNLGQEVDVRQDICEDADFTLVSRFDLVVCQATLEHVYAPFAAMRNMVRMLRERGVIVVHTHTPTFGYHPYPRDYVRFQLDWFFDLPQLIGGCELLELYALNGHVFAAIRKTE